MPTIALPAKFGFTRVERLQLTRGGVTMRSRYTGQAQRIIYPFAVWEFEGNLIDYPEDQGGREIRAFLAKLEGQKNNFKLPVPGYVNPSSGFVDNNVTTTGDLLSRATSHTFRLFSAPAGTTVMKEGEYFTINDELKILTSDVVVDAAGNAVVNFQPPMRNTILAAAPVAQRTMVINGPYCLMIASDNEAARWSINAPVRHGFKLEAIEDL